MNNEKSIEYIKGYKAKYLVENTVEYWTCPFCGNKLSTIHRKNNLDIDYYETPCNCSKCKTQIDWYVFTPDGK